MSHVPESASVDTAVREAPRIAHPRITFWRAELAQQRHVLQRAFLVSPDTGRLLREHARLVDRVLRAVWSEAAMPAVFALIAVGGFGRGQLFPYSDVDVVILLPADPDAEGKQAVERFFAALWDIGLEIAHAVRTVAECKTEMRTDITIRTSLLEHRHVAGSRRLYGHFSRMFADALDVPAFFDAKMLEQQQRHLKYHDATYNLEPNVKESPGGLRDLQTVLWIARAAGVGRRWRELFAFQHAHDERPRFRQLGIGKADVHDGLSPLLGRLGRDAARACPRG